MKRIATLTLLATLLATSASAQENGSRTRPAPIDVTWRALVTPNGCVFYEGDLLNMVPDAPRPTVTFSGACKPGEAITGTGTITRKRQINDYNTTRTYKGSIVGGYLNGKITIVDSLVGISNPKDRETSPAHTFPYRMGCMVLSGTDGDLESGSIGNQMIQCVAKTTNIPPAKVE